MYWTSGDTLGSSLQSSCIFFSLIPKRMNGHIWAWHAHVWTPLVNSIENTCPLTNKWTIPFLQRLLEFYSEALKYMWGTQFMNVVDSSHTSKCEFNMWSSYNNCTYWCITWFFYNKFVLIDKIFYLVV